MGDKSRISWTEATWNWVVGCEHVSDGCDNCYAASLASTRLAHTPAYAGLAVDGRFTGEVRVLPKRMGIPLRWQRPRQVFVNSMSDWLHKDIPLPVIVRALAVMALTRRHKYQALTKRHGRLAALLGSPGLRVSVAEAASAMVGLPGVPTFAELQAEGWERKEYGTLEPVYLPPWPLPNVWVGVSVEDQATADRRIPALLRQPFQTFLSMEPLLGPVDLEPWLKTPPVCGCGQAPDGAEGWTGGCSPQCMTPEPCPIDWVIVGGESGKLDRIRPMGARWAHDIRVQCQEFGVPFWFKQYGTLAAMELGLTGAGKVRAEWPYAWPQEMPAAMLTDTAPPTSAPALAT